AAALEAGVRKMAEPIMPQASSSTQSNSPSSRASVGAARSADLAVGVAVPMERRESPARALKPAPSKRERRVLGCGESMSDGTRRSNQAAVDSGSAKAFQSFWARFCRPSLYSADQIHRLFARCARSERNLS